MHRRVFTHLLLSLLLLFSQQMALAHVVAHELVREHAVLERGHSLDDGHDHSSSKLAKALAHADTCVQCLSLAQIATAPGSLPRSFAPRDSVVRCRVAETTPGHVRPAPCAFLTRAPPQA